MSDKKDVEKLFDSIEDTEAYTGLFNSSDLSDGISFQEAIFTTGEALPQIGLATVGTLTGNPILAGLGTAAMFTQMSQSVPFEYVLKSFLLNNIV